MACARYTALIEQNGQQLTVMLQKKHRAPVLVHSNGTPPQDLIVGFGKNEAPALKDGKAEADRRSHFERFPRHSRIPHRGT